MRIKFLHVLFLSSLLLCACDEDIDLTTIDEIEDIEVAASEQIESDDISPSEQFMKAEGLTLTAKEVQFNMANNLDKNFFIEGTVSLCDYYNYGYTNEKEFFCGKVNIANGKNSDSWYLYFQRKSFGDTYDRLLSNDLEMMISARIFETNYESGQGNMAAALAFQIK